MNKAAYSPAHEFTSILYIQEHSTGINQQYQAEKNGRVFTWMGMADHTQTGRV
jgi:hypothetical protein